MDSPELMFQMSAPRTRWSAAEDAKTWSSEPLWPLNEYEYLPDLDPWSM